MESVINHYATYNSLVPSTAGASASGVADNEASSLVLDSEVDGMMIDDVTPSMAGNKQGRGIGQRVCKRCHMPGHLQKKCKSKLPKVPQQSPKRPSKECIGVVSPNQPCTASPNQLSTVEEEEGTVEKAANETTDMVANEAPRHMEEDLDAMLLQQRVGTTGPHEDSASGSAAIPHARSMRRVNPRERQIVSTLSMMAVKSVKGRRRRAANAAAGAVNLATHAFRALGDLAGAQGAGPSRPRGSGRPVQEPFVYTPQSETEHRLCKDCVMCRKRQPENGPIEIDPLQEITPGVQFPMSEDFFKKAMEFHRWDSAAISKGRCCAFCGISYFGGDSMAQCRLSYVDPYPGFDPEWPPYAMANAFMKEQCVSHDKWHRCYHCSKSHTILLKRLQSAVFMPPPYLRSLLGVNPLHVQLLSVVDASVNFQERFRSFRKGALQPRRQLLSTPLVSYGQKKQLDGDSVQQIGRLHRQLQANNHPVITRWKTLFERGGSENNRDLPIVTDQAAKRAMEENTPQVTVTSPLFPPGPDPMKSIYDQVAAFYEREGQVAAALPDDLSLDGPTHSSDDEEPPPLCDLSDTDEDEQEGFDVKRNTWGLPLVPESAVHHITEEPSKRGPYQIDGACPCMPTDAPGLRYNTTDHVALGVAMDAHPPIIPAVPDQSYVAGTMVEVGVNKRCVELVTNGLGLPIQGVSEGVSNPTGLSLELSIFVALFPFGKGSFADIQSSFSDYLQYRLKCGFSSWTLFKPYLPMMFMLKQTEQLRNCCSEHFLGRDIDKYKRTHPNTTDDEIVKNLLKHSVPNTMPGTPAWHYSNLQDLLVMVEELSMPTLFMTLTADEVSEYRWQSVSDLESFMKRFNSSFTFLDCPVECAKLFHRRVQRLMSEFIHVNKGKIPGIFGRVTDYVIRYEVQGRGSVHAHIILWVHPEDIDMATEEIVAAMPCEGWNPKTRQWIEPRDPVQKMLHNTIHRKMMHTCSPVGEIGCRHRKPYCSDCFPQPVQQSRTPVYSETQGRFHYYCPGIEHRNVVPYSPKLAFVWNAHVNVQRIVNAAWSLYLMKYAMKAEPMGDLKVSPEMAQGLGLKDLSTLQGHLSSLLWLVQPVSPCEQALIGLGIPLVQRSRTVHVISSAPPDLRLYRARGRSICRSNVDRYTMRPKALEEITFYKYFTDYQVEQKELKGKQWKDRYVGQNFVNHWVYKRPQKALVRFSDYSPDYNPAGYFYNLLLKKVHFRDEAELLSEMNPTGCFVIECVLRGFITSEDDMNEHVDAYMKKHMHTEANVGQMVEHLNDMLLPALGAVYHDDPEAALEAMKATDVPSQFRARKAARCQPSLQELEKDVPQSDQDFTLTPDQQRAFDDIIDRHHGLVLLTGGPGSGKSFLTRRLMIEFAKLSKQCLLTGTTGAAALRLSGYASTVHSAFVIPANVNTPMGFLNPTHHMRKVLKEANVIIIDEMSMMATNTFENILIRLQQILGVAERKDLYQKVLIILVGDDAQLPPVCRCPGVEEGEICQKCHLACSPYWSEMHKVLLTSAPRFTTEDGDADVYWVEFLNIIRNRAPTEDELQFYLGMVDRVSEAEALNLCSPTVGALCTHRVSVNAYNNAALRNHFPQSDIYPVTMGTSALDELDMKAWLNQNRFHDLTHVAIGAKVVLLSNGNMEKGACNGATGKVVALDFDEQPESGWMKNRRKPQKDAAMGNWKEVVLEDGCFVESHHKSRIAVIHVQLDSGETVPVSRTHIENKYNSKGCHVKVTFPLMLAYAMTGHRAQGATISTKTMVHFDSTFAPGLAYVILSRLKSRDQLIIVRANENTWGPDNFKPIPEKYRASQGSDS